jgi:hypothetical protein
VASGDGADAERYVVACALAATVSRVLVTAHELAGAPSRPEPDDREFLAGVAQARTAAGAGAVVAGRLLAWVREHEARLNLFLAPVSHPLSGVTVPDLITTEDRRATSRAIDAAVAESQLALAALDGSADAAALVHSLHELRRVCELATRVVGPHR